MTSIMIVRKTRCIFPNAFRDCGGHVLYFLRQIPGDIDFLDGVAVLFVGRSSPTRPRYPRVCGVGFPDPHSSAGTARRGYCPGECPLAKKKACKSRHQK